MNRLRFLGSTAVICILLVSGCASSVSVPAGEAAEVWYNLGNAYTELGRNDDAIKAYLKARQLNPELVSAGFNLVRVQILQRQYDDSLEQLELLLEADPENRLFLETKAWVYHLKGDDAKALGLYDSVLDIFSDSRNSLYNSSIVLVDLEEYDRALVRMKRLVELYPDEKSSVFEIAKIEAALGNSSEALQWISRHLSESPDDYTALELAGDMYALEKQYAEAVESYRRIVSPAGAGKDDSVENSGAAVPADVAGRVSFKIGEILLVYIEDVDGGLSALRDSAGSGKIEKADVERVLSHTDAVWFEEAAEILSSFLEEDSEADESASDDIISE